MALTEKQLLEKKKEIDQAQQTLSELTGEEKALLKQLSTEWGCKTLEDAKKKLEAYKKEIDKLDEQIQEKTEEIEKTYFDEKD
jgi:prefoldin subunit 5